MIIYKLSTDPATGAPAYEKADALPPGAAVALGNFDGVHRGHQRLFSRAKAAGCPVSAAWSFTSLAKAVNPVPALTDIRSKLRLFAACGLDYAILEDFEAIRSMTPAVFASQYLPRQIRAGSVVCGFNFRFGKGGTGDADALRKYLAGVNIPVIVENPVLWQNRIVSSSVIRGASLLYLLSRNTGQAIWQNHWNSHHQSKLSKRAYHSAGRNLCMHLQRRRRYISRRCQHRGPSNSHRRKCSGKL